MGDRIVTENRGVLGSAGRGKTPMRGSEMRIYPLEPRVIFLEASNPEGDPP